MNKQFVALIGLLLMFSIATMTGCNSSTNSFDSSSAVENNRVSSFQTGSQPDEENHNIPSSNATELTVQFGDGGEQFVMHLGDNSTTAAIAGYVGTTDWRLPVQLR